MIKPFPITHSRTRGPTLPCHEITYLKPSPPLQFTYRWAASAYWFRSDSLLISICVTGSKNLEKEGIRRVQLSYTVSQLVSEETRSRGSKGKVTKQGNSTWNLIPTSGHQFPNGSTCIWKHQYDILYLIIYFIPFTCLCDVWRKNYILIVLVSKKVKNWFFYQSVFIHSAYLLQKFLLFSLISKLQILLYDRKEQFLT